MQVRKLKILLSGKKWFGAEVLREILALGHEVVAVSSHKDDKLKEHAAIKRIRFIESGTLNESTCPAGVDLIVAAHSHDFIGRKTRNKCTLGAIGYHPSLLPLHRGRDAVEWTIRMKDKVAGGSVYWLSETVDGGPIAAQDWCFVRPEDDARELWRRDLGPMGVRLIKKAITDISSGVLVKADQDSELATWEPAISGAPRLYRPDLEMLGEMPEGYRIEKRLKYG